MRWERKQCFFRLCGGPNFVDRGGCTTGTQRRSYLFLGVDVLYTYLYREISVWEHVMKTGEKLPTWTVGARNEEYGGSQIVPLLLNSIPFLPSLVHWGPNVYAQDVRPWKLMSTLSSECAGEDRTNTLVLQPKTHWINYVGHPDAASKLWEIKTRDY